MANGKTLPTDRFVANIALDLIFTIITFGLYNLVVQYRQCKALNKMLNQEKYSFGWWLVLVIVTFGLYHIYHEYRQAADIEAITGATNSHLVLLSVLLTCFALHPVCDALQQSQINRFYGYTLL